MQNSVAKKIFAVGSAVAMTLSLVVPFAAQAAAHATGTNVSSSDGTVWMVTSTGTRRAYTSAGAFLSYGFNSWSQVVPASAEDLALPVDSAGFIPPQDGTIFCATATKGSDVKGECALISGGMKRSFTSASVFTGLGFSFARAVNGDSSFMSKGANVDNSTMAHLPGVLVNNNGTVQLVGSNGLLGVPDLATFNSWGYSFANVVPANAADKAMTQTGVMVARLAGQLSPSWTPAQPCTSNCTPPPANGGGLSVSLSSATPAASNVAAGAAFIPFTAINFTAAGNPVVVTGVKVKRGGLGADSNLNNMYLFNGAQMLAQSSSVQNGVVTYSNSAGLFTVPANSTLTIWVKGDLSSGTSSGLTYTFSVNAASDITSNASSVSGSFPITGNMVTSATVVSPSLASLTVAGISTGGTVNAGTNSFLAAQYSLQSANSSVKVNGITLTFVGSAALSSIANVKLMANGTQVGSTMTSLSSTVVFFDLSSAPLMVPTGNTVNLQVIADITGSANRTGNLFSIQRNYDIQSYDTTYNVGILSSSTFPVNGTSFSINAGTLTVNRDVTSRTTQIAPGQTNLTLATFSFQANGEDVKILNLPFKIAGNGSGKLDINNIKLVDNAGFGLGTSDTTEKNVVATPYTNSSGAVNAPGFQQTSNFNYVIPANTTRLISIVADIISSTTSTTATASLTGGSSNAQGVVSVASITTPAVSGNTLTVSTTLLTATLSSGMANPSLVVPNSQSTKVGSFAINAGGADSVDITTVQVTTGATSVAANFNQLAVMVGTTQVGQTQTTLSNSTAYSFSPATAISIPAGGSVTIDVYAGVQSGAETSVNQNVVSLTGLTSQLHTSGSTITFPGLVTGQTVKVTGNGAVTITQSPNTPVSRQLAMNQAGQILGVIKIGETTGNEAATLTDITITATGVAGTTLNGTASASLNSLLNFTISAADNAGTAIGSPVTRSSWTSGTDGTGTVVYTVTFNNVSLAIPAGPGKYMNLTVKADLNSFTNGAASNSMWTVGLASASAATIRGTSSTATITPTLTANATSNTTTVLRTTIGVASVGSIASPVSVSVSPTGVPSATENMAIFAVTASNSGDAIVQSITLQQGGTAPTGVAVNYTVFDAAQGLSSAVSVATAITGSTATAVTLNLNSAATAGGVTIGAGQTKYLVVQANTTNFNTNSGNSSKSYSLQATTWRFSDGTTGVGPSSDASSVTAVTTGASRTY